MSGHAGKREWPFRVLKTISDEPKTELPTQGASVRQKSTGIPPRDDEGGWHTGEVACNRDRRGQDDLALNTCGMRGIPSAQRRRPRTGRD